MEVLYGFMGKLWIIVTNIVDDPQLWILLFYMWNEGTEGRSMGDLQNMMNFCFLIIGHCRNLNLIGGTDSIYFWPRSFRPIFQGISQQNMALYDTVPPFQDPEIPIDLDQQMQVFQCVQHLDPILSTGVQSLCGG